MKLLPIIFVILFSVCAAQPSNYSGVTDKFSKAFNKILSEAPANFEQLKGRLIRNIDSKNSYRCSVHLPGSKDGRIVLADSAYCTFTLSENENFDQAESSMIKMASKITTALGMKVILKYSDDSSANGFVKQTKIGLVKSRGFSDYNILLSMHEVADLSKNRKYSLFLTVKGGEPIFYNFIRKNEPVNSLNFSTNLKKMGLQFERHEYDVCKNVLPGFDCQVSDSGGKPAVVMRKYLEYFPNAKTEFEALISATRSALGENYIYFFTPARDNILKQVVFVKNTDYELKDRRSIALQMIKEGPKAFTLSTVMYYP
jgi:hypothetical protein